MKKLLVALLALLAGILIACEGTTSESVMVEALLSRMTLAQKIGQMTQAERAYVFPGEIKQYYLGSMLSGGGSAPGVRQWDSPWGDGEDPWVALGMTAGNNVEDWKKMHDMFQSEIMSESWIDAEGNEMDPIPLIYGIDAVHGNNNIYGAVVFPHNIGLGAMRDPQLMKKIGAVTAEEVKASGIRWTFAPCFAVVQDIRWGRSYESFGERGEIAASYAGPLTEGLEENGVISCAKHYIGDGATSWGTGKVFTIPNPWSEFAGYPRIDQGNVLYDEAVLRSEHLVPFKNAVDAGANTVMISYSSFQGMKMHEHAYLINDVLKGELGFDGLVVSDYNAIDALPYATYYEQVAASVNAGVDMMMVTGRWKQFISELTLAVNNGDVSMDRIDDAVRRILRVKIRSGLFKDPYVSVAASKFGSSKHRKVAAEAVRKSLVLLKNEVPAGQAKKVLPLVKNMNIFVAGRAADDIGCHLGGWTISWQGAQGETSTGTTILDGITDLNGKKGTVSYSADATDVPSGKIDVAVVVIGEKPYAEFIGDDDDLSIEKGLITSVDRNEDGTLTVHYSDEDMQTLARVKALGVPTVVIMLSGRPMIVGDSLNSWDAFVAAWLPGTEGAAVADVLYGSGKKNNFTGKLSFTWPKSMDYFNVEKSAENTLYPYGYGLSY